VTPLLVPVTPGELIDRITIQQIKVDRFPSGEKLDRAIRHLDQLMEIYAGMEGEKPINLTYLFAKLKACNEALWLAEDGCRIDGLTDEEFGRISRHSHSLNEERFELKRAIDLALGAELQEDKSYK
jgi:hypothetical protein